MGFIKEDEFICIDCEATGLDPKKDKIIEVAAVRFTFKKILDRFETLIDPRCLIPEESRLIHNISQDMVQGKPKIYEVIPDLIKFIQEKPIVGHAVYFDIALIHNEALTHHVPCQIKHFPYIDTLRLARLYGQSPTNSLETLRKHFNIQNEGAHRAMNDVIVNIEVFKHLAKNFKTTEELFKRMEKPICLTIMPLGKHKGRRFNEIPLEYLLCATKKNFDHDLMFSIRSEIKNRKKGTNFHQASNPFQTL